MDLYSPPGECWICSVCLTSSGLLKWYSTLSRLQNSISVTSTGTENAAAGSNDCHTIGSSCKPSSACWARYLHIHVSLDNHEMSFFQPLPRAMSSLPWLVSVKWLVTVITLCFQDMLLQQTPHPFLKTTTAAPVSSWRARI